MASRMPDDWYKQRAEEEYTRDGEIEFDDDMRVSPNDDPSGSNGAYVQGWVWIDDPEEVRPVQDANCRNCEHTGRVHTGDDPEETACHADPGGEPPCDCTEFVGEFEEIEEVVDVEAQVA